MCLFAIALFVGLGGVISGSHFVELVDLRRVGQKRPDAKPALIVTTGDCLVAGQFSTRY